MPAWVNSLVKCSKPKLLSLQLPQLRKWIHKVGQGQACRIRAVGDDFLNIRSQQCETQDTGGVTWTPDSLIGGNCPKSLSAFIPGLPNRT